MTVTVMAEPSTCLQRFVTAVTVCMLLTDVSASRTRQHGHTSALPSLRPPPGPWAPCGYISLQDKEARAGRAVSMSRGHRAPLGLNVSHGHRAPLGLNGWKEANTTSKPFPLLEDKEVLNISICVCLGAVADCSGLGLLIIPAFKQNITTLLFAFNKIRLRGKPTFGTVVSITHLDLSYNRVHGFDAFDLLSLRKLKVLDISGNLAFQGSAVPTFSVLDFLQELDISQDPESMDRITHQNAPFIAVAMPRLKKLLINFCNFFTIDMEPFTLVPSLRELEIVGTQDASTEFKSFLMPQLERLDLSNNSLRYIINSCYDMIQNATIRSPPLLATYFPRLLHLDLTGNLIGRSVPFFTFSHHKCFPELRSLVLNSNLFIVLKTGEFSADMYRYPKLEHLSLKAAGNAFTVESLAFNNPGLLTLDLSQNRVDFASSRVNESAFDGCVQLTELNLEGNNFRGVSDTKFTRLFADLTSLRVLNLGNTKMDRLSREMWRNLNNLSTLLLHDNLIAELPDGAFDDLRQLTVLRLDDNHISWLSESVFSPETRGRLLSLNLSQNPFVCTCSLQWFHDWMVADPGLFHYRHYNHQVSGSASPAQQPGGCTKASWSPLSPRLSEERHGNKRVNTCYGCSNLLDKDVVTFLENPQPCFLGHDAYVLTVVCSVLLIVFLAASSQAYRYRWHVRLLLYEAFRGRAQDRQWRCGPEDLQFDLFVSYDSEDEAWVTQHLMPVLEQQMGLRLCVHMRDFIPGKNIVDNIVDCLENSKRVMAVFSPSFADSPWCHFELEMCLSHMIDKNDVMVVVMLRHVPSRDMSGAMRALVNTATYIQWGDNPEVRATFWRKITLALTNILPGRRR